MRAPIGNLRSAQIACDAAGEVSVPNNLRKPEISRACTAAPRSARWAHASAQERRRALESALVSRFRVGGAKPRRRTGNRPNYYRAVSYITRSGVEPHAPFGMGQGGQRPAGGYS